MLGIGQLAALKLLGQKSKEGQEAELLDDGAAPSGAGSLAGVRAVGAAKAFVGGDVALVSAYGGIGELCGVTRGQRAHVCLSSVAKHPA